jgi:hypothetical protein
MKYGLCHAMSMDRKVSLKISGAFWCDGSKNPRGGLWFLYEFGQDHRRRDGRGGDE